MLYAMTTFPTPRAYAVIPHPVTGDPYVTGDALIALAELGGTVSTSLDRDGFTVRGWLPGTNTSDDPDTEAVNTNLEEGIRLVLGTLLNPIEGECSSMDAEVMASLDREDAFYRTHPRTEATE